MASSTEGEASGSMNSSYFVLRRLHSLSGIIPVGVFVVMHLAINSRILTSGAAFDEAVGGIHLLSKLGILIPVEVLFIFLPLAFHAGLGVWIAVNAEPNAQTYRYGGNVRYSLQRATAWITLVFILFHLWQMHWLGKPFGGGAFEPESAAASAAEIMQQTWWWPLLYALGVIASVFHLSNGIWTSLITWGITIGPRAQRMSGYACTAFGLALGLAGVGAAIKFYTYKPEAHGDETVPAHTAAIENDFESDLATGDGSHG